MAGSAVACSPRIAASFQDSWLGEGVRAVSRSPLHETRIGSFRARTPGSVQQDGRIVALMAPPQPLQRSPGATGGVKHTMSTGLSSQLLGLRIAMSQAMPALSVGCGTTRRVVVRAEYRRGGGGSDFFAGFVLGGVVFGALGYLVAPQLVRSISEVAERERVGVPKKGSKYLEEDDTFADYPKPARQDENSNDDTLSAADQKQRKTLVEKIAQLNAAIDNISAQLSVDEKLDAVNELEPAA